MEPKTDFIEFERYQLFTPARTQGGKRGNLRWGIYLGNPRLICWPTGEETRRPVIAGMNPETFLTAMAMFTKLADAPDVTTEVILESDRKPRDSEGTQAYRVLGSVVRFGRDEDGVLYIRVTSEGVCDEKFMLRSSDWHRFKKADGRLFTPREDSTYQTKSYITGLQAAVLPHTGLLTKDKPARTDQNQGRGQQQQNQTQAQPSSGAYFTDIV